MLGYILLHYQNTFWTLFWTLPCHQQCLAMPPASSWTLPCYQRLLWTLLFLISFFVNLFSSLLHHSHAVSMPHEDPMHRQQVLASLERSFSPPHHSHTLIDTLTHTLHASLDPFTPLTSHQASWRTFHTINKLSTPLDNDSSFAQHASPQICLVIAFLPLWCIFCVRSHMTVWTSVAATWHDQITSAMEEGKCWHKLELNQRHSVL